MAGSTSGGISDLAFVMNMRIDESSVTDSMRTLGDMKSKMSMATFSAIDSGGSTSSQDIADTKFAEAQQHVAQLDAAYEASEQQRLAAIQAQEDANEAAFAAMLQHVAQLDAAQEASEQQRRASEQAIADAAESSFAAAQQHVAQLDAAQEANEQQRLAAEQAQADSEEAAFAAAQQNVAQLDAAYEAAEQQRLAAIQAQADAAETAFASAQQHVAQLDAAQEAAEQQRLAAEQTQADAAEAAFAAAQQQVAQLDAAYEASEQQRLAAEQAIADAAETEFAAMLQHVAQLDAAEEAAEQQRLNAVNAEIDAIEGDMTRALRRTLNIEDQINFDYQRRLEAIDAIQGATAQQTAELRLQAAAVRDAATQTAINAGQIGGIGRAGLTGQRIQEFGRGFEDFTVGFSMAKTNIEGIAMGLRGSANNAAQLAASFNPMVGATVAIGASLATVIVPMVARWLWDTKELEKAQDAWNEKLKESGREQVKVAEAQAKMLADVRADAKKPKAEQGKGILENVRGLEEKATATKEGAELLKIQRDMSKQRLKDASAPLEKQKQEASDAAAALVTQSALADALAAASGDSEAERRSEAANAALKETERQIEVETARVKKHEKELKDAADASVDAALALEAVKKNSAAAIAKAEKDIQDAAKEKLQEQLDDANDKAEKNAIKSAERQFEEDVKNIKALKLSAAEENEMISDAAKIGRLKIERAEDAIDKKEQAKQDKEEARLNKYEDMQQRIDADAGKATKSKEDDIMAAYNKRTEEINRLEGNKDADKLAREKLHASNLATFTSKMDQEQAAQNDKLAVKRIDAELQANADQQDALQERMQNAGNAAGPSAAMVSGTQAAESAINRALSGSQSVEGTMKAQLKVLQEIHKDLQKQKQAKTVSL